MTVTLLPWHMSLCHSCPVCSLSWHCVLILTCSPCSHLALRCVIASTGCSTHFPSSHARITVPHLFFLNILNSNVLFFVTPSSRLTMITTPQSSSVYVGRARQVSLSRPSLLYFVIHRRGWWMLPFSSGCKKELESEASGAVCFLRTGKVQAAALWQCLIHVIKGCHSLFLLLLLLLRMWMKGRWRVEGGWRHAFHGWGLFLPFATSVGE